MNKQEEENRLRELSMRTMLHTAGLSYPLRYEEGKIPIKDYYKAGVLPKTSLVDGAEYYGLCRNALVAKWHANKKYSIATKDGNTFIVVIGVFTYTRHKFDKTFDEDIVTIEDDDGFDLFLPFTRKLD